MDFLTHLCLPLTVVYVLRTDLFDHPLLLTIGGFGLLSDFDKFLGVPGLLHSLVTLVPICLGILALERGLRGEFEYAPVIVALVLSHLVLDFVDGGPVPLLFPVVDQGIGLTYPVRTVFGTGPVGIAFEGPVVAPRMESPRPGYNTYGFVNGAGVASALALATIYSADRIEAVQSVGIGAESEDDSPGEEPVDDSTR